MQFANNIEAQAWQGKLAKFLDKFLDAENSSDQAAKTKYNEILSLSDVDLMDVRISFLNFFMGNLCTPRRLMSQILSYLKQRWC